MVLIDFGNGLVWVMVGGKDFFKSQFNCIILVLCFLGFIFKLFFFVVVIDWGMKFEIKVFDVQWCWNGYCFKNFGNKYYGNIFLVDVLKNLFNMVVV